MLLNTPWALAAAALSAALAFILRVISQFLNARQRKRSTLAGILSEVRVTRAEIELLLKDFENLRIVAKVPKRPTLLIISGDSALISSVMRGEISFLPDTTANLALYQRRYSEYNSCAELINSREFKFAGVDVRVMQVNTFEEIIRELDAISANLDISLCKELRALGEFDAPRKISGYCERPARVSSQRNHKGSD